MNPLRDEIVGTGDQYQQANEEAARLVIEKQRDDEQVAIAHQPSPSWQVHGRSVLVLLDRTSHEGESDEDDSPESPEPELREEQRRVWVESKQLLQVFYDES